MASEPGRIVTPLAFGDEPPVDRTPMAFAARAACGHVRSWVYDDGSAAAARWAGETAGPGVVLARVPVAEARAAMGRCARCGTPEQAGMGL